MKIPFCLLKQKLWGPNEVVSKNSANSIVDFITNACTVEIMKMHLHSCSVSNEITAFNLGIGNTNNFD